MSGDSEQDGNAGKRSNLDKLRDQFILPNKELSRETVKEVWRALEMAAMIARKYKSELALPEEFGDETTFRPVAPLIEKEIRDLKLLWK